MLKTIASIALLAACLTSVAEAQQTDALQTGMRVRLSPASGKKVSGTIARLTRDTIYLSTGSAPDAVKPVSRDEVGTVEFSRGTSHLKGTLKGLGLGVLIGAGLGALHGALEPKRQFGDKKYPVCDIFSGACSGSVTVRVCTANCGNFGPATEAAAFGFVGIPLGAVIGAIVGSERWASFR